MNRMTSTARLARIALVGTMFAALIGLAPDVARAADSAPPATHGEYVPFVTDFPEPMTSTGTPEPFVPFATDFPKPAAAPAPAAAPKASRPWIAWDDMSVQGGVGAAVAALLAGAGLALARRARPTTR